MIKKEKTKRAAPSPSSVIDVKCTPSVGVLRVHLCRCFFTGPCPASGARVGATVVCPWSTVVPCTAGRNTNFPARASARPWVEQRKTVTLLCVSVCHPSIHQLATQRQSLSSELVRCCGRGFCPFWPGPCVCVCVCVFQTTRFPKRWVMAAANHIYRMCVIPWVVARGATRRRGSRHNNGRDGT